MNHKSLKKKEKEKKLSTQYKDVEETKQIERMKNIKMKRLKDNFERNLKSHIRDNIMKDSKRRASTLSCNASSGIHLPTCFAILPTQRMCKGWKNIQNEIYLSFMSRGGGFGNISNKKG